jgi:hypothetical protein
MNPPAPVTRTLRFFISIRLFPRHYSFSGIYFISKAANVH